MDRTSFLWTLTVFFGATVAFGLVRNLADGHGVLLSLGLQLAVLALIVGGIVVVMRRQR